MRSNVAQRLEAVEEHKAPTTPAQVIPLRPSVRKHERAWAKRMFIEETVVEAVLVTATLFLVGGLYYSLYQALQNYIIIGLL